MILLEIDRQVHLALPDSVFYRAAEVCLRVMNISSPCSLSLTLADDSGIRHINKTWRNTDKVTDVLSFPSLPVTPDALFHDQDEKTQQAWDSETGAFFLGDIIINVHQANKQATDYQHALFREMTYLFVHGMFHLLGYDHINKEDKTTMRNQEEKALQMAFETKVSDEELLQAAREARAFAHTPYSHYKVGAALLCTDGTLYTGCNVENASYGLTNCAERTAVFKAISEGNKTFEAVAIAADQTAPWPCGACRQVMTEFAPKMRVLITWGENNVEKTTLDALLPHGFLGFEEDQHG